MKRPTAFPTFFLVLLYVFVYSYSCARTVVPLNIVQSVTWTKAGSPYVVETSVNIAPNVTLTIEKGTSIEFYVEGEIQLSGQLIAKGTKEESINFISKISKLDPINYKAITLNKGCALSLNYCNVTGHFYFLVDNNSQSLLNISNSNFTDNSLPITGSSSSFLIMHRCTFKFNYTCVTSMALAVDSTTFEDNSAGMENITGHVSHSVFKNNKRAGIRETTRINLDSNIFQGNGIGLGYVSEGSQLRLKENIFIDNIITGIRITGNRLPPTDSIYKNQFCNPYHEIENNSLLNFDFSNNCWCSADTSDIFAKITNVGKAYTTFQPLHVSCRGCKPTIDALKDTICDREAFLITVTNKGESPFEQYRWVSSLPLINPDSASVKGIGMNDSSNIQRKKFQLILSNKTCTDSADIFISVYPKFDKHCRTCIANAGIDSVVCSGAEVILGSKSDNLFYQYYWSPPLMFDNHTIAQPVFSMENTSSYSTTLNFTLTVRDTAAGCVQSDTIHLTILPEYASDCKGLPPIHVYNVITPNGDAQNQHFTIDNIQFYPNNEVSVYNRWGNKIMHQKNYNNDWDGNNVPEGVYYYIVSIPEMAEEFKGDLTIKK